MSTLVGFHFVKSKKSGKEFCIANVVTDYGTRDIENDCVGSKVAEIFLPEEQLHYLTPADIGKEVLMDYEISGGRAYLVSMNVVRK